MPRRASTPLNSGACSAANDEIYSRHEADPRPNALYDAEGNRQPLSASDPSQSALRTEWMDLYVANGGKIEGGKNPAPEDPAPESPAAPDDPVEPCPGEKKTYFLNLNWVPAKGYCGDKTKLFGTTNLPDGEVVGITLKAKQGISSSVESFSLIVTGGKIEKEWEIHNVDFRKSNTPPVPPPPPPLDSKGQPLPEFLDHVDVEAVTNRSDVEANEALLKVEAMLDQSEKSYDATRGWSGFSNHSHFKQKLEKFRNKIKVELNIIKAWGAYWVNLTSAGITGTAGNCPWDGYRWGRATTNPMQPSEYYDGTAWVPLPPAFVLSGLNHSAVSFYKSGTKFRLCEVGSTAKWPDVFTEYDFNSAAYTARRKAWVDDTHSQWSDQWHFRRKDCKSNSATRCCRYDVDVTLVFTVVNAFANEVVAVCPGSLRSNASNWFLDESRITVAAHETGHHMDNPDEYTGGAVDTSLNDDGAVNGIDDDSMMGQNLTKVKKRHYHAFGEGHPTADGMLKKMIKSKYGREYIYETVART